MATAGHPEKEPVAGASGGARLRNDGN